MQEPITGDRGEQISRFRLGKFDISMPRRSYLKNILAIIKLLAGLVLLVLSVQGIQWGNLVTGIRSANPAWLVLAIASVLVGLLLKVWGWAILVKNYGIQTSV